MPFIEDKYSDTIGYIIFQIESGVSYEAISTFYETGAVPYSIKEKPEDKCIIHLVRLRQLPSLEPMGLASPPTYTLQFQTNSFREGVTRMVIRDAEKQCVVRFEKTIFGWCPFVSDAPPLEFCTDL